MISGLFIFIELTAILYGIIFFAQDYALFHPNSNPAAWSYIASLPDFEAVEISSGSKTWHGILRRPESDGPSPLIIFFSGNGQNAAQVLSQMEALGIWPYFNEYQFLLMDYPGYGQNGGQPSAKSMYREALAVFDYASELPEVSRIIVGSYSIGTGPAVYLAANRDADGLFLLAPFDSGYDLFNSVLPVFYGPLRLFVRHKFPSGKYAELIDIPALVIASTTDEVVPFPSSLKLCAKLGENSTFVTLSRVDHNSILFNRTTLESVKGYLDGLGFD